MSKTRRHVTKSGRAFTTFAEQHPDALGPKSSLLILGDTRSNYSDLAQLGEFVHDLV